MTPLYTTNPPLWLYSHYLTLVEAALLWLDITYLVHEFQDKSQNALALPLTEE